jgi:hypothetical protein
MLSSPAVVALARAVAGWGKPSGTAHTSCGESRVGIARFRRYLEVGGPALPPLGWL